MSTCQAMKVSQAGVPEANRHFERFQEEGIFDS
jgi:hypothetical protein